MHTNTPAHNEYSTMAGCTQHNIKSLGIMEGIAQQGCLCKSDVTSELKVQKGNVILVKTYYS